MKRLSKAVKEEAMQGMAASIRAAKIEADFDRLWKHCSHVVAMLNKLKSNSTLRLTFDSQKKFRRIEINAFYFTEKGYHQTTPVCSLFWEIREEQSTFAMRETLTELENELTEYFQKIDEYYADETTANTPYV